MEPHVNQLSCDSAGKVALEMYTSLTEIQNEKAADPAKWIVEVL